MRYVRLTTWNIDTLMGKTMKLVDVTHRRKIDVACLQEMKWREEKAKD